MKDPGHTISLAWPSPKVTKMVAKKITWLNYYPISKGPMCWPQILSKWDQRCLQPDIMPTFARRLLSSCGWSFWTSPSCSAAERRMRGVEPVSNSRNRRSNLERGKSAGNILSPTQQNQQDEMAAILQMSSNAFFLIKRLGILTRFHGTLFLRVQFVRCQQ